MARTLSRWYATSSLRVVDATDVDGNDAPLPAGTSDAARHSRPRENDRTKRRSRHARIRIHTRTPETDRRGEREIEMDEGKRNRMTAAKRGRVHDARVDFTSDAL